MHRMRMNLFGIKVGATGTESNKKKMIALVILAIVVLLPLVFFGMGFLVQYLWKVTLVDLAGLKEMSFWQAWAMILLCWILFKANVGTEHSTGTSSTSQS